MELRLETVAHFNLMLGGKQQPGFVNRHVGTGRNFFTIKYNHETGHALHSRNRKTTLVDPRIVDRAAKGPTQSVFTALQRMKVVEQRLIEIFFYFRKICVVVDNDLGTNFNLLVTGLDDVKLRSQKPSLIEIS